MKKKVLLCQLALAAMSLLSMLVPQRAQAVSFARAVTANFNSSSHTAAGASLLLNNGEQLSYRVVAGVNPNVNTALLEKSCNGLDFGNLNVNVSTANNNSGGVFSGQIAVEPCAGGRVWYRFRPSSYTSGTSSTTLTELDNINQSVYNNNAQSIVDFKDGGIVVNGYFRMFSGALTQGTTNLASLQMSTPIALGDTFYCSDCVPKKIVIGTGTVKAGDWADAVGLGLK